MRPTLDNWYTLPRGYVFGQKTFYSNFHLGTDVIVPTGTIGYAPESGDVVAVVNGPQGGLTLHFKGTSGVLYRFLHLSAILQSAGHASEGEPLYRTGNSGSLTTNPHLHADISRNGKLELTNLDNFINPDIHFKSMNYDGHIIRNKPTGAFAYVKGGKKQEFNNTNGALALTTFIDRLPQDVQAQARIVGVEDSEYSAIPNTSSFFPPRS